MARMKDAYLSVENLTQSIVGEVEKMYFKNTSLNDVIFCKIEGQGTIIIYRSLFDFTFIELFDKNNVLLKFTGFDAERYFLKNRKGFKKSYMKKLQSEIIALCNEYEIYPVNNIEWIYIKNGRIKKK